MHIGSGSGASSVALLDLSSSEHVCCISLLTKTILHVTSTARAVLIDPGHVNTPRELRASIDTCLERFREEAVASFLVKPNITTFVVDAALDLELGTRFSLVDGAVGLWA